METHVEFRSDRFPAHEWESQRINPGRYGKRLAAFLRAGLAEAGLTVGEPVAEDWGWLIRLEHRGFRLWVGCGNYDQYPGDGFLCFIEPHTMTVRRFPWIRRVTIVSHVEAVRRALDNLLSAEPGIRDARWSTYEKFIGSGGQTASRRLRG